MLLVKKPRILPIVFHRLTKNIKDNWEDVDVETFKYVLKSTKDFVRIYDNIEGNLEKCWVITFDDGNLSDFEISLPLLIEYKCKGIFFVVTDLIGKPGYLNWSQLREMIKNGMVIGSHSKTHRMLTKLSDNDLKCELKDSKHILENALGMEIDNLSFPYGSFTKRIQNVANSFGYNNLFCSKHGFANIKNTIIPRNSINGSMDFVDIDNVLFPKTLKRCQWFAEDIIKGTSRTVLGDEIYRRIRDYIYVK